MAEWYDQYLKSDHWERTKINRLLQAKISGSYVQCEAEGCGLWLPLKFIDIHHKTYKRLGCECMEDLAVWCRACHTAHHGFVRPLWWDSVKASGATYASEAFLNQYRGLTKIGEVMFECLQFHELDKELAEGAWGAAVDDRTEAERTLAIDVA